MYSKTLYDMLQNEKSKEELLAEIDSLKTAFANEKILCQSILNNIKDLLWIVDNQNLTLLCFNDAFKSLMTQKTKVSIQPGVQLEKFQFFRKHRNEWLSAIKKAKTEKQAVFEIPVFSDHKIFRFHLYLFNFTENQSSVFVVGQDISSEKIIEHKYLASERKYLDLYENAIEGFFRTTIDAQIVKVNKTAWHILGYSQDEIKEVNVRTDIWVIPEERDRMVSSLLATNYTEPQTIETQLRKKDGSFLWVSIKCQIITENEFTYIEGSFIDINSQKIQEHESQKRKKDLKWYQEVAISRELRMVELKKEINELLSKLGMEKKYPFIQ